MVLQKIGFTSERFETSKMLQRYFYGSKYVVNIEYRYITFPISMLSSGFKKMGFVIAENKWLRLVITAEI